MDGVAATMDSPPDQHGPPEGPAADFAPESPHCDARSVEAAGDKSGPDIHPQRVVEAILFAADAPLPPVRISALLGVGDARDVRKHIAALNAQYESLGLAFRIQEIAGGFQMLTLPAYNTWLVKLLKAKVETRLSPASLETLAIVAYKQPCTRADIEAVRGVAAGDLLNRLREMNLIKIVGRAEDLGRPLLYGTTRRFLEVFGLPSIKDLPEVEALGGSKRETVESPRDLQDERLAAEDLAESEAADNDEPSPAREEISGRHDGGADEKRPRLTLVNDENDDPAPSAPDAN